MAWKFDNPWGGGNSQNLWDIDGAEAQKVLQPDNGNFKKGETIQNRKIEWIEYWNYQFDENKKVSIGDGNNAEV